MRHTFFTVFLSWLLLSISSSPAFSWWNDVFTDSAENPVTEYYFTAPGDEIYVKMVEQSQCEATITGTVSVERPPANNVIDREAVTLTNENYPDCYGGYFGPAGGLPITFDSPTEGDGTVQGKVGDKLIFYYDAYPMESVILKKHPTASTAALVDDADTAKSEYFIGIEEVWLRVTDDDQNEDPAAADTITVTLFSNGGDLEFLTLTETGINTGMFRGSMASETDIITVGDGTLQVADNTLLTAYYIDPNDDSDSSSDTTRFVSSGIIVHKVTEPAGDSQSFNFILTGGPDNVSQSFALTHGTDPHNSGPIKPGTYNLSETSPPDGWERKSAVCDDGSAPGEITLDYREVVTCTFINTKRTLTVAVIQKGSGRGTVTSTPPGIDCGDTCTTEFGGGSVVTLIATPQNGSIFTGWSDPCTGTAPCIVHMPVDQTVSAEFYRFSWPMIIPAITYEKGAIK